tara:strand:- start:927 stop:2108 length:1182 start_codon:yes stop_codon:yes gene_type:complete
MWQKTALDEREIPILHKIQSTLSDILSDTKLFPGTNRYKASKKLAGITGVDLESGLVDVQLTPAKKTQMKFGKYLHGRGFDADTCREASSKLKASVEMVKGAKLEFTSDGDEASDVYENGPFSCMSDCESVRSYDSVDICVAYVKLGERIVARTLVSCNQESKVYLRIYGNRDIIKPLLYAAGYVKGDFEDLTIAAIEYRDTYYAPWRDDGLGYTLDGDRLLISSGGEGGASTNGTLGTSCERCGVICNTEDMYWSDYHEEQQCESCHEELHVYINHLGESFAVADDNIVCINHDYYHIEDYDTICYSEHENEWLLCDDAIWSEYAGEYYKADDVVEAITKLDEDTEVCHSDHCVELENEEGEEVWVHDDIASAFEEHVAELCKQLKLDLEED